MFGHELHPQNKKGHKMCLIKWHLWLFFLFLHMSQLLTHMTQKKRNTIQLPFWLLVHCKFPYHLTTINDQKQRPHDGSSPAKLYKFIFLRRDDTWWKTPFFAATNSRFSGTIAAATTTPFFSGECQAVACPQHSTGRIWIKYVGGKKQLHLKNLQVVVHHLI